MKKLYFTDDFSAENIAKLQEQGYTLRDLSSYKDGDFIEQCDEVAGDAPQAYLDVYPVSEKPAAKKADEADKTDTKEE